MLITPLQYFLRTQQLDTAQLREHFGVSRTTLWRWSRGDSHPQEPQKLIDYCSSLALFIEGVKHDLDYNGIYQPSIRVTPDFFDNDSFSDPHVSLNSIMKSDTSDRLPE